MVLDGDKCRLRTVDTNDTDTLLRWENDPEVWRYGGEGRAYTRAEIEEFARNQQFDISATGQQRFMIVAKASERVVGTVDLYDYDIFSAGVGILIYDRADRRMGYATEALGVLARYAESLRIARLHADIADDNTASRRLFEKCGFCRTEVQVSENVTRFALDL